MSEKAFGVDFGTSTSLVAESGLFTASVVEIGHTQPWMPSVVAHDGGRAVVGENALALGERRITRSLKRAITSAELPVTLEVDGRSTVMPATDPRVDDAIVAMLAEVRVRASVNGADLGAPGTTVRLGCPAMWKGDQRRRLIGLAERAGIPVGDSTLIDEPIAAAVAWIADRVRRAQPVKGKVLVFDIGGGTLDIAVLDATADLGVETRLSVQAADGLAEAGDSLDEAIARDLEKRYREAGVGLADLPDGAAVRSLLRAAATRVKVELSDQLETTVVVRAGETALPTLLYRREELEHLFTPQLAKAMELVWSVLRAALLVQTAGSVSSVSKTPSQVRAMTPEDLASRVDYVLVTGGMSRVPEVKNRLQREFPGSSIEWDDDPTSLVARGLGEDLSFDRLNLHRPGFDFVVEWEVDGVAYEEVVYRAYSPLYPRAQVFERDHAKHEWRPVLDRLPHRGQGMLRMRSVSGAPIGFRFAEYPGEVREGVPFTFGRGEVYVSFQPNGRVYVRDGAGQEREFFVSKWPAIRGRGTETVEVRMPVGERPWRERLSRYEQSHDAR